MSNMYQQEKPVRTKEQVNEIRNHGKTSSIKMGMKEELIPNIAYVRDLESQISKMRNMVSQLEERVKRDRYEMYQLKQMVEDVKRSSRHRH